MKKSTFVVIIFLISVILLFTISHIPFPVFWYAWICCVITSFMVGYRLNSIYNFINDRVGFRKKKLIAFLEHEIEKNHNAYIQVRGIHEKNLHDNVHYTRLTTYQYLVHIIRENDFEIK